MGDNTTSTPKIRSRSVLKENLAVLEIKASSTKADIEIILDGVPKGEINQTLAENQYSVKWPSFGLGHCTKLFYVTKEWWIYDHSIVMGPETRLICTDPIASGAFMTQRR